MKTRYFQIVPYTFLAIFILLLVLSHSSVKTEVSGELLSFVEPVVAEYVEEEVVVVAVEEQTQSTIEYEIVTNTPVLTRYPTELVNDLSSSEKVVTDNTESGADRPRRLIVPVIDIDAQIHAMGLTTDGSKMDVPNNYTDIGWYLYGAVPGDSGTSVLGAHVDNGSNINGVFKYLKNLKIGDDIFIDDEGGQRLHFKVQYTKVFGYKDSAEELYGSDGKKRLNLVTCHGSWLRGENNYNERLVIFTELVEN